MSKRSDRNKIKHNADAVLDALRQSLTCLNESVTVNNEFIKLKLKKAQRNANIIALWADDRSDYINENLPVIITYMDMLIKTFEKFEEGL